MRETQSGPTRMRLIVPNAPDAEAPTHAHAHLEQAGVELHALMYRVARGAALAGVAAARSERRVPAAGALGSAIGEMSVR